MPEFDSPRVILFLEDLVKRKLKISGIEITQWDVLDKCNLSTPAQKELNSEGAINGVGQKIETEVVAAVGPNAYHDYLIVAKDLTLDPEQQRIIDPTIRQYLPKYEHPIFVGTRQELRQICIDQGMSIVDFDKIYGQRSWAPDYDFIDKETNTKLLYIHDLKSIVSRHHEKRECGEEDDHYLIRLYEQINNQITHSNKLSKKNKPKLIMAASNTESGIEYNYLLSEYNPINPMTQIIFDPNMDTILQGYEGAFAGTRED